MPLEYEHLAPNTWTSDEDCIYQSLGHMDIWGENFRLVWPKYNSAPLTLAKAIQLLREEFEYDGSHLDKDDYNAFFFYVPLDPKTDLGRSWVIFLRIWYNTPRCHSLLAHEIEHLVLDLMESKGFIPSRHSEEAYCYTVGYLTKFCLEALGKHRTDSEIMDYEI